MVGPQSHVFNMWSNERVPQPARGLLSYSPHSGHADQMRQLTLARALAELLGRTLVLPPLLRHFDATATTTSTAPSEATLASRIRKFKRPSLSWLLNMSALGIDYLDWRSLPVAPWQLPSCVINDSHHDFHDGLSLRQRTSTSADAKLAIFPRCVVNVEPPPVNTSVSIYLQGLAHRLARVPLIHFRSMIWVHSERSAKRYPLPAWEDQLISARTCALRIRQDMVAAALDAINAVLPKDDKRFLGANVRALREAHNKGESEEEWTTRLLRFVRQQNNETRHAEKWPIRALFIASDDEASVVPKAAEFLRSHGANITVFSSSSVGPDALRRLHAGDTTMASLALDLIGIVAGAERFSGSPRSGLSVHLLAMRACERMGTPCEPHACIAYAHPGCGGSFPAAFLRGASDMPRHGPLSKRCSAMDNSLREQGLERTTAPRAVRPLIRRCIGTVGAAFRRGSS